MRLLIFSLMTLVSTSCADHHKWSVVIDPEFTVYIDMWHNDAKTTLGQDINIQDIHIAFANLNNGRIAQCTLSTGSTPFIEVDIHYWAVRSNYQHKMTIYHELGHCILGKDHNLDLIVIPLIAGYTYSGPKNIMYPSSIDDFNYYNEYKSVILKEYFVYGE